MRLLRAFGGLSDAEEYLLLRLARGAVVCHSPLMISVATGLLSKGLAEWADPNRLTVLRITRKGAAEASNI
jgi:hypothetical protein